MATNESTMWLVPAFLVEPEQKPLTVYGLSESLNCRPERAPGPLERRDEKTED